MNRLKNIQKQLHDIAQSQLIEMERPPDLIHYQKQYHQEIKRILKPTPRTKEISRKELIHKIAQHNTILIGDYHCYEQSQRTALRILRDLTKLKSQTKSKKIFFGFELLDSSLQKRLDLYLKGKIDSKKWIQELQSMDFSIPWKHYLPIFEWCKEHQIAMIALNRPKKLIHSHLLHSRDQWSAALIVEKLYVYPQATVLVLYGDYHLSPGHLPHQIQFWFKKAKTQLTKKNSKKNDRPPQLSLLSIYQNDETLFWKYYNRSHLHTVPNVLWLDTDRAMIFSGTPWQKSLSLSKWIQGQLTYRTKDEWISSVVIRLKLLAKALRISPPVIQNLISGLDIHQLEIKKLSENQAAALAGILIFDLYFKQPITSDGSQNIFYRELWGQFSTLVFNPRRKIKLYRDLSQQQQVSVKKILQAWLQTPTLNPSTFTVSSSLLKLSAQIIAKKIYDLQMHTHTEDLIQFLSPGLTLQQIKKKQLYFSKILLTGSNQDIF